MKKSSRKTNSNSKSQQILMVVSPYLSFNSKCKKVIWIASLVLIGTVVVLLSTSSTRLKLSDSEEESGDMYTIEVVNEFPHDPEAFTQGILYAENDTFFESTGLNGRSSLRKVALHSGKVLDIYRMNNSLFGEGLTLIGDRLFQVTWLQNIGFIYDRNNFSQFETFKHDMLDGWGLGTDGKVIFGTDGTSTLYHIDPHTYKVIKKLIVKYNGHEVQRLNELEFINGQVWANVWQTNCIARISPKDGAVLGWILLDKLRQGLMASGNRGTILTFDLLKVGSMLKNLRLCRGRMSILDLCKTEPSPKCDVTRIDVLNGIAWDKDQNRIFVTGKLWPKLFEIKVHPMKTPFDGDIEQICMPTALRRP